jgi:hypothetical protein
LTAVDIPSNASFALLVKTSGGTPIYDGQFNWQVSGVAKNAGSATDRGGNSIPNIKRSFQ